MQTAGDTDRGTDEHSPPVVTTEPISGARSLRGSREQTQQSPVLRRQGQEGRGVPDAAVGAQETPARATDRALGPTPGRQGRVLLGMVPSTWALRGHQRDWTRGAGGAQGPRRPGLTGHGATGPAAHRVSETAPSPGAEGHVRSPTAGQPPPSACSPGPDVLGQRPPSRQSAVPAVTRSGVGLHACHLPPRGQAPRPGDPGLGGHQLQVPRVRNVSSWLSRLRGSASPPTFLGPDLLVWEIITHLP